MKKYLYQHAWFQLFALGFIFFLISEAVFLVTGSLVFFLLVVYIGAFIVPVTFVTYFYEYVRDRDISQPLLTTSFVIGGTIGLVAAGLLESESLSNLSTSSFFHVAIIEECAKLIFPLLMFIGWKYKHEADGLLFGVAAGMGFAALETLGYAITFWAQSGGDISGLQQLLIIRGATSPAGHAAWTGFVCAIMWHQRQKTG
ncbi:MAG: PrsW family intramembrane metalloprotease, partial [Dehalococcoidia bacterium]